MLVSRAVSLHPDVFATQNRSLLTVFPSCVSHLAHQPPPVAELLAELHASGTLSSDGFAQILESPNILPYAALHRYICLQTARNPNNGTFMHFFARILASSLRLPVSERDRLLLVQLDGNFRFGQNELHHQDLSGIQVKMLLGFVSGVF